MSGSLSLLSLGLCTSLGLTASSTRAEIHAGTRRYRETMVHDSRGEPIRAAALHLLSDRFSRTERIAALAVEALRDCLSGAPRILTPMIPLHLGLAAPDAGAPVHEDQILSSLERVGLPLAIRPMRIHRSGRSGFFELLDMVASEVDRNPQDPILLGVADSLVDATTLLSLSRRGWLLGALNRDGRLCGEAAGFALLSHPQAANARAAKSTLMSWSTAHEPNHFLQDRPNLAAALTAVLHAQLASSPERAHRLISGQPAESYWARELAQASLRCSALMPEPFSVELVSASLGDVGVASGLCLLNLAIAAPPEWEPRPPAFSRSILYSCADYGAVGACSVEVHP